MTALYFEHLRAPDRVSVKPHAAPVLHAINYLLGTLDRSYLTRLREFGGLQSYPSRAKDPGVVDFSTGSVGIGATATLWSAIAQRYVAGHFDVPQGGRHVALVGDAELDEGAIWEALVDPMVARLGEVLWIVDLNRQSLDRVVPDMAVGRLLGMFEAAGWETITVKYGRRLRELFARPGGESLRERIDSMSNEEYQRLLRSPAAELRERLPGEGRGRRDIERLVGDLDDGEVTSAVADLGGHDLADLLDAFRRADAVRERPAVIFAYTIKARGLPTQGHPANHSALMTNDQWAQLAGQLGADVDDPWAAFPAGTPEAELCRSAAERLQRVPLREGERCRVPRDVGRAHAGSASTQQAFGRFFVDLALADPEVAKRVVTVSPDVASSTNLGGWINRAGVWNMGDRIDWFADDADTLVRWRESSHGQHIELGIAEGNLVGPARRARRHVVARRPAAAADRHALRPVRQPGARAVVVRDLRRRPVDPRRHALRRHARARGRRAPVDHHPLGRARAAPLRRLGAGLRPGSRVDAARRARRSRPRRRHVGLLPPQHPARRPGARRPPGGRGRARGAAPAGARRRLPPAPCRARARGDARRHGRGRRGGPGRGRRAVRRGPRGRRRLPDLGRSRLPRAAGPAGTPGGGRRDPRRRSSRPRAARRS